MLKRASKQQKKLLMYKLKNLTKYLFLRFHFLSSCVCDNFLEILLPYRIYILISLENWFKDSSLYNVTMAVYNISYPEFMNHLHEHLQMSKYQKRFLKKLEKDFVDTEIYEGDGNFSHRISVQQCQTGKHKHSYWITFRFKNRVEKGQLEDITNLYTTKTLWCKGVENNWEPTHWWEGRIRQEIHTARRLAMGYVD